MTGDPRESGGSSGGPGKASHSRLPGLRSAPSASATAAGGVRQVQEDPACPPTLLLTDVVLDTVSS